MLQPERNTHRCYNQREILIDVTTREKYSEMSHLEENTPRCRSQKEILRDSISREE